MKAMKVTGTYEEIYEGINALTNLLPELKAGENNKNVLSGDIGRTPFLGNKFNSFKEKFENYQYGYYAQGDMSGSAQFSVTLFHLFFDLNKLAATYKNQLAYFNDNNECAGTFFLAEQYSEDLNTEPNPKHWIMTHTTNTNADLPDREVTIYLSEEIFTAYEQYLVENNIADPFQFEEVSFHQDLKERMNADEISHIASKLVTNKGETNKVMAKCWDNIVPGRNIDPTEIERLYLKDLLYQQIDELAHKAEELQAKAPIDAEIARQLADGLKEEAVKFFEDDNASPERFKEICNERIKDARPQLKHYKPIENVLKVISSVLNLIYGLYSLAKHGEWKLWYNPKPKAAKNMDEIEKTIEESFKPKP